MPKHMLIAARMSTPEAWDSHESDCTKKVKSTRTSTTTSFLDLSAYTRYSACQPHRRFGNASRVQVRIVGKDLGKNFFRLSALKCHRINGPHPRFVLITRRSSVQICPPTNS